MIQPAGGLDDSNRARVADASYTFASLMFILALAGLSAQSTAKKGNAYGMIGMRFAHSHFGLLTLNELP